MKKKYVILIIAGIVLVIGGYFGYKGFNLYANVYSLENSSDLREYYDGLKLEDTITINKVNEDNLLTFNELKIRNDFTNFELKETSNENNISYILKDNPQTIFTIKKTTFDFYERINNDETWIHNILKEKHINNDLDLILYTIENKESKPNIFSSINEMKFYNYVYNLNIQSGYLKFESIKLIDGDLKGFILETKDMAIREIFLINGTSQYVISLWNKEYFTYDYIEELLKTITFDTPELTNIKINYKEMYIKENDYNTLKEIFNNLDYKNNPCNNTPMYVVEIEDKKYFYSRHLQTVEYNGTCANITDDDLNNSYNILQFVYSDNEMNNIENVKMEIKEGTLSNTGLSVIITDTNEEHYQYGEEFRIDRKENGIWEKLKITGNNAFNQMAYSVNEKNQVEFKQNWELIYGKLKPGEYRLVKDVCVNDGCYESKYFCVEFVIE